MERCNSFLISLGFWCLSIYTLGFQLCLALPLDPLPSWREGEANQQIIHFVQKITNKASRDYVKPADRVAVFDNDGTLMLEQPVYAQVLFAISQLNPRLENVPLNHKNNPFVNFNVEAVEKVFSGMTLDHFKEAVKNWLARTKDKRFNRYFTELVYQPMLEVLQLLHYHQFKVYIVTAGEQEFVRSYAEEIYHIPVERVIGSTTTTKYLYDANHVPTLFKEGEVWLNGEGAGKARTINLFIGKKPIIAFGNSDGDREMLEWTQSSDKPHLLVLVHHDDAEREYSYDNDSKIGHLSSALLNEAKVQHWQVLSMKRDWLRIFPFNESNKSSKTVEHPA